MTRRRRHNVFMNPAGWAYASPQGSLDTSGTPTPSGGPDASLYGTPFIWIDPALGVTLSGSDITAIDDQSTEGNDLTEATNPPSLVSESANFNSKPTMSFDGTNEVIGRASFVGGAEAQANLFVMAYKPTTTAGTGHLFDGPTARNMARISGGTLEMFAGSAVVSVDTADTTTKIVMFLFNGASSDSWMDGVPGTIPGTPGADAMNGVNIGANTSKGAGEFFSGEVAYFVGYDADLSTVNKNLLGNALATYIGTTWTDIV